MATDGTRPPRTGKVSPGFFDRVVRRRLGAHRSDVLEGPGVGRDVGVARGAAETVLVATTDPFYVLPQFGWRDATWFGWQIVASDLATAGLPPQFVLPNLNLPPRLGAGPLRTILSTIHEESRRVGAAVLTGHTGRYEGVEFPILGALAMLAFAPSSEVLTARETPVGARLLVTRSAALEAAVTMAYLFPRRVRDRCGPSVARRLRARLRELTVVPAALAAVRVGRRADGVWAMHDATEGGVRTAIWEMARASGKSVELDAEPIPVDPDIASVCREFHLEPLRASSEGTLLLAAAPDRSDELRRALGRIGIPLTDIGRFTGRGAGVRDRRGPWGAPAPDSFWPAVQRARRKA